MPKKPEAKVLAAKPAKLAKSPAMKPNTLASKLWEGRFSKPLDKEADAFNRSIAFDCRLYREDIAGSIAHATMLAKQEIISENEAESIIKALGSIKSDIDSGKLEIDRTSEDIHSFIEIEMRSRIGNPAKRLHTARSRNDQVALDLRMHVKGQLEETEALLKSLISAIVDKARASTDALMPGYTHLQRAQPVTYAHYLLAYAGMFERDMKRLQNARESADSSPLGAAALAGTSFPIDRRMTAAQLGFSSIIPNSIDAVSDRDFVADACYALSMVQMHLSRMSEEIILHCSSEFGFITLDDAFCTGSSIMPQKKNPDMAELVRGKTGRVYGNLIGILTTMKGLPLAYNKDMQEDKETLFDSIDTVKHCLSLFAPMITTMTVNKTAMRIAASTGFINATDCADYLCAKGLPFREAYKLTGEIISWAIKNGKTLETMSLDDYKTFSELFENDIFTAVDLDNCLGRRSSEGGPSKTSVEKQLQAWKEKGF